MQPKEYKQKNLSKNHPKNQPQQQQTKETRNPHKEQLHKEVTSIPINTTLQYYDTHASQFIAGTKDADMSELYEKFERLILPGSHILDLGCGSGRDSKYFLKKGYEVTAVDGSYELCKLASAFIGQKVHCMRFEELKFGDEFDAVWACASLLHAAKEQMPGILQLLSQALKKDGILYASFKYGDSERIKDGRFFNDCTEVVLDRLFCADNGFRCLDWQITQDVREDRPGERWLNVWAVKI